MLRRRRKAGKDEQAMIAQDTKVTFVSSSAMDSFLEKYEYEEKEKCLEIGNIGPVPGYTTLDIRDGADYIGDVRGCITNDYECSDDLELIPQGTFLVVKMVNVIEHIQWIYQSAFFDWINKLLVTEGMVYIDTPNLEFIAKVYVTGLEYAAKGLLPKFPGDQYPGMTDRNGSVIEPAKNLQRWVQFKLFSGCSPGDFHHCCYDAYWLARMLADAGFDNICINSEEVLKVAAFKSGKRSESQMDAAMNHLLA